MIAIRVLSVVIGVALLATAATAQDPFRVSFDVDRSRGDKVQLVGQVRNDSSSEMFDVNVTAEALDRAGRVVASGITYVEGRIAPGESRPFVAVVPVAPGAVRYRAVVSSYRAGFGYQAP
jgi:hypothetical protein